MFSKGDAVHAWWGTDRYRGTVEHVSPEGDVTFVPDVDRGTAEWDFVIPRAYTSGAKKRIEHVVVRPKSRKVRNPPRVSNELRYTFGHDGKNQNQSEGVSEEKESTRF